MKQTNCKKLLSFVLCIVLIAAMALFTTGCNDEKQADEAVVTTTSVETTTSGVKTLGEGEKSFNFTVTDADGNEQEFLIKTDKTTVGDALLELEMIAGDEGDYGLYVKTVNGITVDYDTDGCYWAFYVNGEYASSGVDLTEITEGATYSFKVEK